MSISVHHSEHEELRIRWLPVWLVSFCVWIPLSAYIAFVVYVWQRDSGMPVHFGQILIKNLINYSLLALLTPAVYYMGRRYPLERGRWAWRVALHVAGSLLFAGIHAALRISILPTEDVVGHVVSSKALLIWRFFVSYTVDDSVFAYWPVIGLAHLIVYRQKYLDRELRSAHLQTKLAEAQLRALKMQIHPHFLFNTLHSISSLMHTDVSAADKMLSRLSDLLRLGLEGADTQECPLRQELKFLDSYLHIEQVRFSDRLSVSMEIDPDTYDATVPYMILQPLVENAVRHGVSKLTKEGKIRIRANRENGWLRLAVQDNGPGFSLAEEGEGGGLGLSNTRERMEKLYGERQSFSVQRLSEGGVEVCVLVPFARHDKKSRPKLGTDPMSRRD
jgi:two-component system LytT family sensor kinase